MKDRGLEKAISGHYYWRMFCVILLFTTAAIFAQMIMGNRGIQMEIEYVVKQDKKDVEQILEKYSTMLEMSREYIVGLSEQERDRYFSVICAKNEHIDGVIYVTEEDSVVYREDGSVVRLANICTQEELILIRENTGSRFGFNDMTKQNYLLLSVQEGDTKQSIGFFFQNLELLFENIGEYLCEGTLAFEVLCEKETAKHLTQLFGSASQEDFLERIDESQYKEIVHMSGMDKVLDKLQHQFYVYVSAYENWNFVHVYFFDVTQIGQLYLKNHSTLLGMMILVGFFLMTAGGYWHEKVYHKRRLARIKQQMSNSGIFRFMFDSKKIFLMSLDENFKIENVSEKLIDDLCDMPASEAIGNNLFFILKSNRLKEFVQEYQESGEETRNTVISFYERKYKKKAWYFVEIQNVPDEVSGENRYLLTFFEANSLLMAERVLHAIMQNTKDFMLILDEQYHVSFISEEAKRRMGIRKNVVGKLLRELPACQIDGRTLEEVLSGVTRYQPFDGTVHVDMPGEEKNWWATANAFVLTRENESYGILMVLKDITEYLEKTEEVASANKVKENLLFTVSHGIKTPLNALLGSADMLLTTMKKDAAENAYLKNMKQAVKELAGMLDEVLDFTKLDSDKMVLEEQDFDFAKMLENFASEAYISAQSRGLAFYMDISADVPESIYADEQWLKKALSNLVHIFTVMTAEGYLKLHISCEERRFDEKYLHIELEGTGTRNERTKQSEFYRNGADKSGNYNSENILCEFKYFMCRDIVRLMGSTLEDGKKGQNKSYTSFDLPLKTNAERNIVDCMELSGKSVSILMQNRDLEEHCGNVVKELQMVQTTPDKADFLLTDGAREYSEVQKRRGKRCLAITEHVATRNKHYEGMLRQPFSIRSLAEALRFEKKADDSLEEEAKLLKGVKHIHALVVDDNSVNLMIATNMFKLLGATTETAEDGIQAIEKVKITKYDVILMDHLMPNMDGVCATKEIRNLENGSCLIFALTADLMEQVARMFEEAGADESLAKPLDLRTLKKKLLEWLPEEHLVFEGDEEAEVQVEEEVKEEWKLPELKAVKERCPEIQIEVGLSYLQGNEEQYSKVLQATVQSLEDGLAKLPDAPNGSKEQRILVHGMKGMYFGIGAEELAKKAADLEAAIKQENVAFVSANVASFIQASVELKDKLQGIFATEEQDSDEKLTLSKEEYEQLCDEAMQALEMFDPDTAIKHLNTLIAASEGEGKECMKQAKKKADNFDYEEALNLLEKGRGLL